MTPGKRWALNWDLRLSATPCLTRAIVTASGVLKGPKTDPA